MYVYNKAVTVVRYILIQERTSLHVKVHNTLLKQGRGQALLLPACQYLSHKKADVAVGF